MPRIRPSSVIGDLARLPLGQAKVHDVRLALGVEHDVARLEVAMDHAALVGMVQAPRPPGHKSRPPRAAWVAGRSASPRGCTLDEVADDVDRVAVAADFMDAHDVADAATGQPPGLRERTVLLRPDRAGPCAGILIATIRSSSVSRAFQTVPNAPAPSCSTSSKWPTCRWVGRVWVVVAWTSTKLNVLPHEGQVNPEPLVADNLHRIVAVRAADVHIRAPGREQRRKAIILSATGRSK